MGVTIEEVSSRRALKEFVAFPDRLYANNPYRVPPLRFAEISTLSRDKNPAFEFCDVKLWLARRDGKTVGRVAGIINNRYIEKWGNKYARFGWIDFVDDREVSGALLNTLETWARERGMQAVHGPLGFTDLDQEGMLVEGFEELGTLATIYNHPYYPVHMEHYGYRKDVDWVEYEVRAPQLEDIDKLRRMAEVVTRRNKLTTVKLKKQKDILPYAKGVFSVLNEAFEGLYGVVSLTDKQIDYYIKQYLGFVRPDYISIVLDEAGKVAAFAITLPSLSLALQKAKGRLFPFGIFHILKAMKKNDTVDLCLIGVRPDLQGKGVNAVVMWELTDILLSHNIVKAETNHELESNDRVQNQWKLYEHRQHKRRRCFIKPLNA